MLTDVNYIYATKHSYLEKVNYRVFFGCGTINNLKITSIKDTKYILLYIIRSARNLSFNDKIVSTKHFGSILVETLEIISTFKMTDLTTQQLTFITEITIETKSPKKYKDLFKRNSDVLLLQENLFCGASRVSTKQETFT